MSDEKHEEEAAVTGGSCRGLQGRRSRPAGGGYSTRSHDVLMMTKRGRGRAICIFLITFLVLAAGITALILWLVYRPHKPNFRVLSAAVFGLNATTYPPFMLSATMQFTLTTRNSNRRVSFSYDQLSAFVSYRNQAITPPVMLPAPLYHETKSTLVLSPVLGGLGASVPVSPEVSNGLAIDEEAYGVVALRLVLLGKLRYKVAAAGDIMKIRTGRYGIYVKCDMLVGLRKGFVGQVPLLPSPPAGCKVDT